MKGSVERCCLSDIGPEVAIGHEAKVGEGRTEPAPASLRLQPWQAAEGAGALAYGAAHTPGPGLGEAEPETHGSCSPAPVRQLVDCWQLAGATWPLGPCTALPVQRLLPPFHFPNHAQISFVAKLNPDSLKEGISEKMKSSWATLT